MEKPLDNILIAITRPREQAKSLDKKLKALGANTLLFPTIDIAPIENNTDTLKLFDELGETDFLIFISRNAVRHSANDIKQRWPQLKKKPIIMAIGHGTASELQADGLEVNIIPDTASSESLLELIELKDVKGKRITIVRGDNGRELLATTLKERGAIVHYAETYHRHCPKADIAKLLEKKPDLIITTSSEGLQNLYQMTPDEWHEQLLSCSLLVVSEHMSELAENMGFSEPAIIADGASDSSIIKALI